MDELKIMFAKKMAIRIILGEITKYYTLPLKTNTKNETNERIDHEKTVLHFLIACTFYLNA